MNRLTLLLPLVLTGCPADRLEKFGDLVAHPDEVRAVRPRVASFTIEPGDGRPLTAQERRELEGFLRDGTLKLEPRSPTKCAFNAFFALSWRKGDAQGDLFFCFHCCEVASNGLPIKSFACNDDRFERWATGVLKTVPPSKEIYTGY